MFIVASNVNAAAVEPNTHVHIYWETHSFCDANNKRVCVCVNRNEASISSFISSLYVRRWAVNGRAYHLLKLRIWWRREDWWIVRAVGVSKICMFLACSRSVRHFINAYCYTNKICVQSFISNAIPEIPINKRIEKIRELLWRNYNNNCTVALFHFGPMFC